MEKESMEDGIRFVASHYKKGAFDRVKAWNLTTATYRLRWRRRLTAAAAAAAAVVVASALTIVYDGRDRQPDAQVTAPYEAPAPAKKAEDSTAKFEFDGVALTDAVKEIEKAYGVKLEGVPSEPKELTLTFEGTAPDLISLINESLDTNIAIAR